jgi:hypothetical protein
MQLLTKGMGWVSGNIGRLSMTFTAAADTGGTGQPAVGEVI